MGATTMAPDERTETGGQSLKPKRQRNFVRVVVIGGLLGAFLLSASYYFWISRPIGKGAAGPAVDRNSFQKPWITRPVLLVGIGDSVTAGFGARKNYSYFDLLITNSLDD